MTVFGLVVVGASWGGLEALSTLAGALPPDFPIPIVLVQHRGREVSILCELLQDRSRLTVVEAVDKMPLVPSCIYIAPPDYHLLVEVGYVSLTTDPPVRFSRPSIDVVFMSAGDAYGSGVIGVVLTGANADGAAGLRHIVQRGGVGIIQDPATAVSPFMPRAAIELVPSARVLPLDTIALELVRLVDDTAMSGRRR
jgi:two-component system, chemotaxis family, protein-glutamate methylesterase/glutaminase